MAFSGETLNITTADGEQFEVEYDVIQTSQTIKDVCEDYGIENDIPVPNISSEVFKKVLEYCNHHFGSKKQKVDDDSEENSWDLDFINVDQNELFSIILASNYLDIKPLLDLSCQAVAKKLEGKSTEEMRKMFGIKNDFEEGEEEKIRKENEWMTQ